MLNLRPFYPRLGYHYHNSNDPEDRQLAFKYMLKAADQAIFRGSYNEALELLEKTSALVETIPEAEILLEVVKMAIIDVKESFDDTDSMGVAGNRNSSSSIGSVSSTNSFRMSLSDRLTRRFSNYWTDAVPQSETKPFVRVRKRVEANLQHMVKHQKKLQKQQKRGNGKGGSIWRSKHATSAAAGSAAGSADVASGGPPKRPTLQWRASYSNSKMKELHEAGRVERGSLSNAEMAGIGGRCGGVKCCC